MCFDIHKMLLLPVLGQLLSLPAVQPSDTRADKQRMSTVDCMDNPPICRDLSSLLHHPPPILDNFMLLVGQHGTAISTAPPQKRAHFDEASGHDTATMVRSSPTAFLQGRCQLEQHVPAVCYLRWFVQRLHIRLSDTPEGRAGRSASPRIYHRLEAGFRALNKKVEDCETITALNTSWRIAPGQEIRQNILLLEALNRLVAVGERQARAFESVAEVQRAALQQQCPFPNCSPLEPPEDTL
ncbi:uncharacterized protein LOC142564535 isoform X2 [Dermacentor variabilis]|uniref:uncharacterized protein LOC142564535 isoform X2 n=1 Tax=Dermacentor variabilis TaxID=34621 RepID=UPI003F5C3C15